MKDNPNSRILITSPITISCIVFDLEKQIVLQHNCLIRVRSVRFLHSMACLFFLDIVCLSEATLHSYAPQNYLYRTLMPRKIEAGLSMSEKPYLSACRMCMPELHGFSDLWQSITNAGSPCFVQNSIQLQILRNMAQYLTLIVQYWDVHSCRDG